MLDGITNDWTQSNLLGKPDIHNNNQEREPLIDAYSVENRVSDKTPPTFIVHSQDDEAVPVQNSLLYYDQLIKYKVPAEMHLFPSGGHGYSLFSNGATEQSWGELCINWLKTLPNK